MCCRRRMRQGSDESGTQYLVFGIQHSLFIIHFIQRQSMEGVVLNTRHPMLNTKF